MTLWMGWEIGRMGCATIRPPWLGQPVSRGQPPLRRGEVSLSGERGHRKPRIWRRMPYGAETLARSATVAGCCDDGDRGAERRAEGEL